MKTKSSKPSQTSNEVEYKSGRVSVKGNDQSETVKNAIRQELLIKWAWILIAIIAMVLYHSVTPLVATGLAPPVISQIRKLFSG